MVKQLLKEPLLHFLLIGAGLFALYSAINPDAGNDKRIVVDDGRINNLISVFEKTWNREPSEQELKSLINDYVLEEIYYRQALEMGIDKNDAMIRRRLRQKMEFFAASAAATVEPDTAELEKYLRAHADKYQTDNLYTFQQVYISTDRSQQELEQVIKETQKSLENNQEINNDSSFLPASYNEVSGFEINRSFGQSFTKGLDSLPLNQWSGPVMSGLGLHFVRLSQRNAGRLPSLTQVHDAVLRDWMYDRTQTLRADLERTLLGKYQVIVDWPEGANDRSG